MWKPGEDSDYGTMGTVCREFLLRGAEGYFLQNLTRRLETVLDCLVALCSPDERLIEVLTYIDM